MTTSLGEAKGRRKTSKPEDRTETVQPESERAKELKDRGRDRRARGPHRLGRCTPSEPRQDGSRGRGETAWRSADRKHPSRGETRPSASKEPRKAKSEEVRETHSETRYTQTFKTRREPWKQRETRESSCPRENVQ